MERISKTIMMNVAEIYQNNLPDTLYLTHYELAKTFGHSPEDWSNFLKVREVNQLIESEIATIAEIGARQAIARLQSSHASSADISAARELLNSSRLIKQRVNQKPLVFITRIPEKQNDS